MGAVHGKVFYIDRSQVERTILCGGQGPDILSRITFLLLGAIPDIDCRSLEYFREIITAFEELGRPKELLRVATICAFAIKVHRKYNLPAPRLADIIFAELNLPWIVPG